MFSKVCVYCVILYVGNLHITKCIKSTYNNVQEETDKEHQEINSDISEYDDVPKTSNSKKSKVSRRSLWMVTSGLDIKVPHKLVEGNENEKDEGLKSKISTLVEQTVYDTSRKIGLVEGLKDQHRNEAPYKAGFILSMIKKSKDVLSELFNVAVRHKNDWKALEQLKIFELIVHTNVDTTNLVRQLVEIHMQHMNTTGVPSEENNRKRVVLIK